MHCGAAPLSLPVQPWQAGHRGPQTPLEHRGPPARARLKNCVGRPAAPAASLTPPCLRARGRRTRGVSNETRGRTAAVREPRLAPLPPPCVPVAAGAGGGRWAPREPGAAPARSLAISWLHCGVGAWLAVMLVSLCLFRFCMSHAGRKVHGRQAGKGRQRRGRAWQPTCRHCRPWPGGGAPARASLAHPITAEPCPCSAQRHKHGRPRRAPAARPWGTRRHKPGPWLSRCPPPRPRRARAGCCS
jgi:hypothetical protein